MEAALEGWGRAGMEQVGKGLHPGHGVSSVSYLFIYFPKVPGRGGHRGWEEGAGGRRERKGGVRALGETAQESRRGSAGGRKALLGLASAEGRRPRQVRSRHAT